MADVLLFHHALGLTEGVRAFADVVRTAGHRVTVPDLYGGRTFATVEEGVAHAEELGSERIMAAGAEVAEGLPPALVYVGFSLGVLPAQRLAQQRAGARGAVLCHAAIALGTFGDRWPDGVALQLHVAADDELGDVGDGQQLATAAGGERFVYPGDAHLFTDASLPDHDPEATQLVLERLVALLERVDAGAATEA